VPNRSAAIRSHLRTVVISLLVAAVVAAFMPTAARIAIIVGVLAWLAYKTYKLVELK
jgi:hypothetical protein